MKHKVWSNPHGHLPMYFEELQYFVQEKLISNTLGYKHRFGTRICSIEVSKQKLCCATLNYAGNEIDNKEMHRGAIHFSRTKGFRAIPCNLKVPVQPSSAEELPEAAGPARKKESKTAVVSHNQS